MVITPANSRCVVVDAAFHHCAGQHEGRLTAILIDGVISIKRHHFQDGSDSVHGGNVHNVSDLLERGRHERSLQQLRLAIVLHHMHATQDHEAGA